MTLSILTQPAIEPVNLAYAKTFLRIDQAHEDGLISDMLVSARQRVEALTSSCLITRRVVKTYPANSPSCLKLTPGPVQIVHDVRAISKSQESAVLPSLSYTVNTRKNPASLTLNTGAAWHDFITDLDAIEVEMSVGYGNDPEDIPHPLKQAILMLLAQSYERGSSDSHRPAPMMVDAVLMPYCAVRL